MKFDPNQHQRRSLRLKGYDSCQTGAYFITIDEWVIMPNHLHGSVWLNSKDFGTQKNFSSIERNYYEHIIRDEQSLQQIRQYILNNPVSWELDQLHPHYPKNQ